MEILSGNRSINHKKRAYQIRSLFMTSLVPDKITFSLTINDIA